MENPHVFLVNTHSKWVDFTASYVSFRLRVFQGNPGEDFFSPFAIVIIGACNCQRGWLKYMICPDESYAHSANGLKLWGLPSLKLTIKAPVFF